MIRNAFLIVCLLCASCVEQNNNGQNNNQGPFGLDKELGSAFEKHGDETAGYIQYDEIRFGYIRDIIDEFAIIFYTSHSPAYKINIELLEDIKVIDRNTMLHEIISILNYSKIGWEILNTSDLDYVTLVTEGGVGVKIDLDSAKIHMISKAATLE